MTEFARRGSVTLREMNPDTQTTTTGKDCRQDRRQERSRTAESQDGFGDVEGDIGICTAISVPGLFDLMSIFPPKSLTRSTMPARPTPPLVPAASRWASVCLGMPIP